MASLIPLLAATIASPTATRAQTVDVTVTVLRFIEEPGSMDADGSHGDYYAKVDFGSGPVISDVVPDGGDISPHWTFSQGYPTAGNRGDVVIEIEIWDDDPSRDTQIDIVPELTSDRSLYLNLDLATGDWARLTPSSSVNIGFSAGDGCTKGPFGRLECRSRGGTLLFDVALSTDGDFDNDGIPDGVERFGVRDQNGSLLVDMPAEGADPCRKTVAVEIDFERRQPPAQADHTHRPDPAAVSELKAAFDAAPVPANPGCPYSGYPRKTTGVDLVLLVDDEIPETIPYSGGVLSGPALRASHFTRELRSYFLYSVFAHSLSCQAPVPPATLGSCNCNAGSDFGGAAAAVTLGCLAGQTGMSHEQAAAFMHELGHLLGLGHGGGDGIIGKPNYVSVMNYTYAWGMLDASGAHIIDYSRLAFTLDQTALSETSGPGGDGSRYLQWIGPNGARSALSDASPIDWDERAPYPDPAPVYADISGYGFCVGPGTNGSLETTPDHNDQSVTDVRCGNCIAAGPDLACDTTPVALRGDDVMIASMDAWCITSGRNARLDTAASGDDFIRPAFGIIFNGPNRLCDSAAAGDDEQLVPVGATAYNPLRGHDDWANLLYRGVLLTLGSCGDGAQDAGEQCDDDNRIDWDGCSADCVIEVPPPVCGDGAVDVGEQCDDAGASVSCDADCTLVSCGDRVTNLVAGEQCDAGGNTFSCDSDCTIPTCGDGVHNAGAGEDCDDGNHLDGDGCSGQCRVEPAGGSCGDGSVDAGEACDDGNQTNGDGCDDDSSSAPAGNCTPTVCGNGVVTGAEECDDGGTLDGDGCSGTCRFDPVARLCPATPDPACKTGFLKASLMIDERRAGRERLVAQLLRGPTFAQPEFGNPLVAGGTSVELCVYDDRGSRVGGLYVDRAGSQCGRKPCWKAIGRKKGGLIYKDGSAASDGVRSIRLKRGAAGKSSLAVAAANQPGRANLPLGLARALEVAAAATVQFRTSDAGCFSATLSNVREQTPKLFSAR